MLKTSISCCNTFLDKHLYIIRILSLFDTVSFPRIKIPKQSSQEHATKKQAETRARAETHDKSVRHIRPLNYETDKVLKLVNLNSLKRVPVYQQSLLLAKNSHSENEVDSALDYETIVSMIHRARLRIIRTLTSRLTDFLGYGWSGRNLSGLVNRYNFSTFTV